MMVELILSVCVAVVLRLQYQLDRPFLVVYLNNIPAEHTHIQVMQNATATRYQWHVAGPSLYESPRHSLVAHS